MPTYQIGLDDGRSLKIEADSQEAALAGVQHFQENEARPPSGVIAGLEHGVSNVVRGPASTIGLTGADTSGAAATADAIDAKNYKSAPIFDKDGIHPGNIPQSLAEAAPGIGADVAVGKAGAMLGSKVGGVRGGVVGGLGGFLGSALLRNFGPGAHANEDALTGVPNSPVSAGSMFRELGKQGLESVPNVFLGGRLVPGASKALVESALAKLGKTTAVGSGASFANDAINQVGTTAGSKDGIKYDPYQGANSATTGALLSAAMASPKAVAEGANNRSYGRFETDPETKSAATDVANRVKEAADGKSLVGLTGGTGHAEAIKASVLGDVQRELAKSAKVEQDLSTPNSNTLARIQEGGTASPKELSNLAAEADPETVRLARQAVILGQVKATGGLSGAMDQLSLIKNPIKTITGAGLAGVAGHTVLGSGLGVIAPAAAATLFGTYGAARAMDKMSGQRSPLAGFANRFADGSPVRADAPAPVTDPSATGAAFNPSAGPWGARGEQGIPTVAPPQDAVAPQPTLRATLNSNAKIDEGMAKIAKQIGDQKRKSMIADAIPALSPIALKMLQQQLKQGRPPTPEPQPAPATAAPVTPSAPVDAFDALKPLSAANVMRKLTAQPEAAAPVGEVSNAPASPAISELMRKLNPTATPAAPDVAPVAPPAPPVIAKIIKKMGKPMEATPAPEAEQPYAPKPDAELWRKGLSDQEVADKELGSYGPKVVQKYSKNVINKRSELRDTLEAVANAHTPEDAALSSALYHRLDDHSRRADARKAIHHYTSRMSAAAAHAVNSHFTDKVLQRMWKSE
jgi:hypothetical protein